MYLNDGEYSLAYCHHTGRSPGILFLGGFRSDMTGIKAMALDQYCRDKGIGFTRFDYMGHGQSSGDFFDGRIGLWLDNARRILAHVATGPQILVGSSMGGWLSLLLARQYPEKIVGLIGVAAAPDFTEQLIWDALSKTQKAQVEQQGFIERQSEYEETPHKISMGFIIEARQHLLLDTPISCHFPVHLLHGQKDVSVPWSVALRLLEHIEGHDARLTLVKGGDHRLSAPGDIQLILETVEAMYQKITEGHDG